MDPDKNNQFGRGRGSILLKLLREKEKTESEAAAATIRSNLSLTEINIPKNESQVQPDIPIVTEIPIASTAGLGRANLLSKLRALQCSESHNVRPTSEFGHGRGMLFKKLISAGSSLQADIQPGSSVCMQGTTQVSQKFFDTSVKDKSSASELSFPKLPQTSKQGTAGKPLQLYANYIDIKVDPERGLFNYEVKYNPNINSIPLRRKLLNQHTQVLGRTKVFDGTVLYLPEKLKQDVIVLESTHPMEESKVKLTIIYKKKQSMAENILFFNVLLGRVMRALSLVRIGRHNFNPKGIQAVPQHKLEVWPGYVTTINEYDGGLKLCIDARHRVTCTETVRDIMIRLGSRPSFKEAVIKELIGSSVLTRYNNKTYRIDDITWDKDPTYCFDKNGVEMSLIDYYKYHWNLEIQDKRQPLLVHRAKNKLPTGETQEQLILLIPELCYTASLSDSIRSDFRIMKDLDSITKMVPNARRNIYRHFVQEVQKNEIPREIFAEWGLHLETDLVEFTGRLLAPEKITFGNGFEYTPPPENPSDWSNVACKSVPLRTTNLNHWYILHCQKDRRCTQEFIDMFEKIAKIMGIVVREPQRICLKDDKIDTFVQTLRSNIQHTVNLMVIIFPTNRTDRYSAVKRVCCVEMPVPSQVIMSRTISRGDKLKSITEKIALQINCKLGGALWTLSVPMENCMICGIDVYHAGAGSHTKNSVAGFVASLDKLLTTWHSKVCIQGKQQEIMDMLQICLIDALRAYYKYNKCYPERIIVYRDGVGDGQMEAVIKYEVKQLLATFHHIEPNYNPTLTVIVVQKRINTRLFRKHAIGLDNPLPGTIVDSYITKPKLYDFYLVSQKVRHGTVSPTHYVVVYDSRNMKPEHIQRLTYKLCHMYYNMCGTIKIPAPCQYAHKLVSLVGDNIRLEPHQSLSDTLYYL